MNNLPLFLSILSLFVSGLSLGWNIYKELMLRARLKVTIRNVVIVQGEINSKRVIIVATNFGPGKSRVSGIHLRKRGRRRWLAGRRADVMAFLQPDYGDHYSQKLPVALEPGEDVTLTFRHLPNLFLNQDFDQVGIADSFGKTHWSSRSNYRAAQTEYRTKYASSSQPAVMP